MAEGDGRGRGRPRDPAVAARVLTAVGEELGEVGVAGFSVNSVSARAGVSKRSIAARWPDRHALILGGIDAMAAGLTPPHTGGLAGDLRVLAEGVDEVMAEPRRSVLARCAAELAAYPEYYEVFRRESVDRCMAAVQDVLEDARRRGDLRAGVDPATVADCFVSALLGSRSFGGRAATTTSTAGAWHAAAWVDIFVHGIALAPA